VNLEDYTPGTICRSLGLGEFQTIWKRGLPTQELKVLLCPSFHPELCLVFGRRIARLKCGPHAPNRKFGRSLASLPSQPPRIPEASVNQRFPNWNKRFEKRSCNQIDEVLSLSMA